MNRKRVEKKRIGRIAGRWGAACILFIAFTLLLAGCHRVTPEGLIKSAAKNAQKASSFKGSMGIHMTLGMKQSGASLNVKMGTDMNLEATNNPSDYHMKGTVSIGEMASIDMEMYGKENPDGSSTTVYTKTGDSWSKSEPDNSEKSKGSAINLDNLLQAGSEPVLQKKLEKVNGKDVFVIKTKVDDMKKAEASFKDIWSTGGEDVDLSKVKADVIIKIYKKSCLPASISVKMKADKGKNPTIKNGGATAELKALSLDLKVKEYDTIDKIKLPEAVKSAAKGSGDSIDKHLGGTGGGDDWDDWDDESDDESDDDSDVADMPKDENGNYQIVGYDDDKKITVIPPAKMKEDNYADKHSAAFYTSQGSLFISAHYKVAKYSKYYTEQDLIKEIDDEKSYTESAADYSDVKLSDLKTIKEGDMEIKYMALSYQIKDGGYQRYCYCWYTTKDGYALQCDISESSRDKLPDIDEKQIIQLVSCIKE